MNRAPTCVRPAANKIRLCRDAVPTLPMRLIHSALHSVLNADLYIKPNRQPLTADTYHACPQAPWIRSSTRYLFSFRRMKSRAVFTARCLIWRRSPGRATRWDQTPVGEA
ncbi:MAG: hypothetical protein RLY12_1008 [Verrucomicrobiota bacterium]